MTWKLSKKTSHYLSSVTIIVSHQTSRSSSPNSMGNTQMSCLHQSLGHSSRFLKSHESNLLTWTQMWWSTFCLSISPLPMLSVTMMTMMTISVLKTSDSEKLAPPVNKLNDTQVEERTHQLCSLLTAGWRADPHSVSVFRGRSDCLWSTCVIVHHPCLSLKSRETETEKVQKVDAPKHQPPVDQLISHLTLLASNVSHLNKLGLANSWALPNQSHFLNQDRYL